jgi:glyoxylase-like metal-dependent hydrolase (beta-lactamase superfamily II)
VSYSIWVLEYGFVDRFPASNLFAAQPNEGHRRMPYCFGLIRSADRCVLVDTGFVDQAVYDRLTAKYGHTAWRAPVDVLAEVGVEAGQVDTILLTHNHFDHAGCVDAFPAAHVYIQRREIEHYLAAAARRICPSSWRAGRRRSSTAAPRSRRASRCGRHTTRTPPARNLSPSPTRRTGRGCSPATTCTATRTSRASEGMASSCRSR